MVQALAGVIGGAGTGSRVGSHNGGNTGGVHVDTEHLDCRRAEVNYIYIKT